MIRVRIERDGGAVVGFVAEGHAGQAERGRDVVCAAVSALTQVIAQGLTAVVGAEVALEQRSGYLACRLCSPPSAGSAALLDTLDLGLAEMAREYPRYLRLEAVEVE